MKQYRYAMLDYKVLDQKNARTQIPVIKKTKKIIMIFSKIQSPQIPSSLQPQDPSQAPLPSPSLSETRKFETKT